MIINCIYDKGRYLKFFIIILIQNNCNITNCLKLTYHQTLMSNFISKFSIFLSMCK